jgi:hypothetical protein
MKSGSLDYETGSEIFSNLPQLSRGKQRKRKGSIGYHLRRKILLVCLSGWQSYIRWDAGVLIKLHCNTRFIILGYSAKLRYDGEKCPVMSSRKYSMLIFS